MTSNADSRCYTKLDWLWKNVEPIIFHVTSILPHLMSYKKGLLIQFDQECGIIRDHLQHKVELNTREGVYEIWGVRYEL